MEERLGNHENKGRQFDLYGTGAGDFQKKIVKKDPTTIEQIMWDIANANPEDWNPTKRHRWTQFSFLVHFLASILLLVWISREYAEDQHIGNFMHYTEQHPSTLPLGQVGFEDGDVWPVVVAPNHGEMPGYAMLANGKINAGWCLNLYGYKPDSGGIPEAEVGIARTRSLFGACAASAVTPTVETHLDADESLVLGSSNSVLYLLLVFEFISASFSLFYIQNKRHWMDLLFFGVALVWNATLFFLTLGLRIAWHIPTNNVIMGCGALLIAMATHIAYMLPIGYTILGDAPDDNRGFSGWLDNRRENLEKRRVRAQQAYENVKEVAGSAYENVKEAAGSVREKTRGGVENAREQVRRMLRGTKAEYDGMGGAVMLGEHYDDDHFEHHKMRVHTYRGASVPLRYVEYALSAPILILAVQSFFAQNSPIWTLQGAYIGILLANLVGVPLHQMVDYFVRFSLYVDEGSSGTILAGVNKETKSQLFWSGIAFLISSWLFAFSAFCSYVDYASRSVSLLWDTNRIDMQMIAVLVVLVPVCFAIFGLLATWTYLDPKNGLRKAAVRDFNVWQSNNYKTNPIAKRTSPLTEVDGNILKRFVESTQNLLVQFDICSVFIKIFVVAVVFLGVTSGPKPENM